MEYLNRIELRGVVGNAKYQNLNDKGMCRFSVATSEAYKNQEGVAVIDTQWFNVVAFESKLLTDLDKIAKGAKIYVSGKVRTQKFAGADGVEHSSTDIIASRIQLLDPDETLQHEMN